MANTLESGLGYAEDVRAKRIEVGELIRLAIDRHFKDLQTMDGVTTRFNKDLAEHALTFFNFVSLSKGETDGGVFICSPWQAFTVISLFGWQVWDTEKLRWKRRFRTAYIEIPKKNGKTSFASVIGLLMQFWDGENGPEVYSAAFTRDQALQCFDEAKNMAGKSPALERHAKIKEWVIVSKHNKGKFMAVSHDKRTTEGKNSSCVILDEYHVHETDGVRNSLQTGMAARVQPLFFIITTAGDNKQGPCYKYREICISVLRGNANLDQVFILIYGIDEGDDWKDERIWKKANPNIGVSVEMDALRGEFQEALLSGTKEVDFKTKHLNLWVDAAITWIPSETWNALARPEFEVASNARFYGGLDLGWARDIASFALYFPDEKFLMVRHYCSEKAAEYAVRGGIDYKLWIKNGHLIATEGETTDYEYIFNDILEFASKYSLLILGYDTYSAHMLKTKLIDALGPIYAALRKEDNTLNYDYHNKLQPFRQGFLSFGSPTRTFEEMVVNGEFHHDGNPITGWMLGNVALLKDAAGNLKPAKNKSKDKIDGIVASIMAIGEYSLWEIPGNTTHNDGNYGIY